MRTLFGFWRWYRRWRGGKWGRVSGFFWGHRWVKLQPTALLYDENWDRNSFFGTP